MGDIEKSRVKKVKLLSRCLEAGLVHDKAFLFPGNRSIWDQIRRDLLDAGRLYTIS